MPFSRDSQRRRQAGVGVRDVIAPTVRASDSRYRQTGLSLMVVEGG